MQNPIENTIKSEEHTSNVITETNVSYFGRKVKELRKARGFTQTQLANAVNLSKSEISKIENGTKESLSLVRIDRILSVLEHTLECRIEKIDE